MPSRPWAAFAAIVRAALALVMTSAALALFSSTASGDPATTMASMYGPFGPEGQRMREQLWLLPSGDTGLALRATVFRPPGPPTQRYPLAVINHGTSEANRLAVSMPVYYWLSRWFIERGFAVVVPQRRGHGATGGPLVESVGDCRQPDHYQSGLIAAQDVGAAVDYMAAQPFVDPTRIVVIGISTGGWASLALAAQRPKLARVVVNFAGGRGGHAWGRKNEVCDAPALVRAVGEYARSARTPTLWLYSENDSYFGPSLAEQMAAAWKKSGGEVEYDPLPAYGAEGHDIADDRAGWDLWGDTLDRFLATNVSAPEDSQVAQGP